MTKEFLYDNADSYMQKLLNEFFSQNVVIPKGDAKHLEWIYNRMVEVYGCNKNLDYMLKFASIIGIKPKEPVYEHMYYTSDGKTEWYTDDEYADMMNSEPYECFKAIETKRERK